MELKEILRNYQVYIDTSALMNTDRLQLLVESIDSDVTLRKKIIILTNVYQELVDFSKGYNNEKRTLANLALSIISSSNAFVVNPEFKRKQKPFADPKILSTLIESKADKAQAIITFDKGLSKDAFNLNELNCINGYEILVLTINELGELVLPECISAKVEEDINDEMIFEESVTDANDKVEFIEETQNAEKEELYEKTIKNKSIFATKEFWYGNLTAGLFAGALYLGKKILSRVL